jgi:hypothetical protein
VVDLVVEVRDARVRYPSTSISPTLPEPPWKENDAC